MKDIVTDLKINPDMNAEAYIRSHISQEEKRDGLYVFTHDKTGNIEHYNKVLLFSHYRPCDALRKFIGLMTPGSKRIFTIALYRHYGFHELEADESLIKDLKKILYKLNIILLDCWFLTSKQSKKLIKRNH